MAEGYINSRKMAGLGSMKNTKMAGEHLPEVYCYKEPSFGNENDVSREDKWNEEFWKGTR